MKRLFSAVALAAFLLGSPALALAQQKAADIPVETFFKRADLSFMTLSPDTKHLAALTAYKGRNNLVVVAVEDKKPYVITSFEQFDVVDFQWVNNKRLFFRVADVRDVEDRVRYIGTYAIDIDGQNLRNLTDGGRAMQSNKLVSDIQPLRRMDDGSDDMIVSMNYPRYEAANVYRLDTRSGRIQEHLTSEAPADTTGFLLDWNRVPRVAWSLEPRKAMYTVWYRDGKDAPWGELMSYPFGQAVEYIRPIAFNADNKTLFVASNIGRDKAAIYSYDPKTKKLGDLIFEHPLIDVWGGLQFEPKSHRLIGVSFTAEKASTIWIDSDFRSLQAQVDATLPKTTNVLIRGSDNSNRILIYAWSDSDPGRYYLMTRNPTRIEELLPSRPALKAELMSTRTFMTYKARDGLEIPAWLTVPKDSSGKSLPLVVHIHGGPWLRAYGYNSWGRPEAQFLASRGYAVLEPEPRASAGFGRKHMQSGFKQWGRAMQDDITDGVLHLVKEGIADKSRVCLYGASYGGYATLQGLVREPDLFRCGIAFVAVSDLLELLTSNESDTNMMTKLDFSISQYKQLGDPSADREMLIANSPAYNAKRIKAPLLLAMGQIDARVPLVHGRVMRSALEDAKVPHEYIVYAGEGHGWNKQENVFDWYKRVEAFLAKHLK